MVASTCVVVGGGLSGLTAAGELRRAGWRVTILDKGRRPGGRLSTRVSRHGPRFDHGAQYLTADDPLFADQLDRWVSADVAAVWGALPMEVQRGGFKPRLSRGRPRYVGLPGMASIVEHLADPAHVGEDVRFGVTVERLWRDEGGWRIHDKSGHTSGPYDAAVVALPAPQAASLLAETHNHWAQQADAVETAATWAVMAAFEAPPVEHAALHVLDSPLAWVAHDSAKPGRPTTGLSCWVMHANIAWSAAHIDDAPEDVLPELLDSFDDALGVTTPDPAYSAAHRWRFALCTSTLPERVLFDAEQVLCVCGDWLGGAESNNAEAAWLSGRAAGLALRG